MKLFFTSALFCALLFTAADSYSQWYARGDFNGWDVTDQLYDDGTNGDPVAGDGIYSKSVVIATAGRYEWKVATADWSTSYPSSNSWLKVDNDNTEVLFTFDTNSYSDIWLPATNIVNCSDQIPPTNDVVAVGDHNGWNNAGSEVMHDDGLDGDWLAGDGIYAYHYVVPTAGTYNWKPTWSGTWDAWGSDNRSINAENVVYTTSSDNEDVYFYLDVNTGRVTTASSPLPVELVSFTASVSGNVVLLNWKTASETNNSGFEVQRKKSGVKNLETGWEAIGFVQGYGTTTEPKSYTYTDDLAPLAGLSQTFYYRLKQIDYDGTFEYSEIAEVDINQLKEFALEQNYPNPFNPSTQIRFSLPEQMKIRLNIYNSLGELVYTLADGVFESGNHQIEFNTEKLKAGLPGGLYIYRLESAGFNHSKKMLLLK
ncbi:MAG: hypothetical protein Kow0098_02530 [Ignavibacteriaceae bacterium]